MSDLNDRQKRDLDNYITGHYGEDQFKHERPEEEDEPDEPEIDEDKLPWRKRAFDHEREIAWSQLGWAQHERARKEIRRQKIEHVCKWITLAVCAVMAVVLFLVWIRP